jgi:hypothetical protein
MWSLPAPPSTGVVVDALQTMVSSAAVGVGTQSACAGCA